MTYKNVTVAGSGVLGYQIAFQAAYHGFNVIVYDISDEVLEQAKSKFNWMCKAFRKDLRATQEQLDTTFDNLSYTSDLAEAVKDADLMIEAIPEIPEIKVEFYEKLANLAPEKTVFATNTSTLLPSQFAESTGRPAQFLALHFANKIWMHNVAEIMGHPRTDPKVFDEVVAFATNIGMVPMPLYKEQPGYIMNSLLAPFIDAGLQLLAKEVADPHTIDKTWMIVTGAPVGPFGILDTIGINTAYNITKMSAERTQSPVRFKAVKYLKEQLIDQNKLGAATGEGFYSYPNPAYMNPDFLK
ncbi:3-hydroxyacyl-CoA dehydrogenase [Psychrobacter sp. Ps3]|uniref:3-hydroxyacyl-CoA dehydrogenase n=1 Tax=Psychrobacter sp. Ps3 TaxID=2790957 RepID=UPI000C4AFE63|nr:3-hydroxyacyl-CoA dehydrogenase [Psychrobacter sp. Ps3]MAE39854.1 3-hydroxybutyryl-CoA dehydrogenase [Psychrobacter sp.]MCG3882625.1 3-hydroxyacyl-CoA dehydrogenase [Psychrobacter sp. Ps3]